MSEPVAEALVTFADRLADAAGAAIRPYFRQALTVDDKADLSPVTVADRDAEAAMRALIARHYPDHGVLGEEGGGDRVDAEYVWVLDPIDGTKSFISGSPLFGTLIALCRAGKPVLGIIDQPVLRERWRGLAGRPTTLAGKPVRTRACAKLDEAVFYTWGVEPFFADDDGRLDRLRRAVKLCRTSADCYAYGLLAIGFVDLVADDSMSAWDYCALVPIVEGAGGRLTDWSGAALALAADHTRQVVAAGDPRLHEQALTILGA